jgi:hypothetical protein
VADDLLEHQAIGPLLRPALRLYGWVRRYEIAARLADELRLRRGEVGDNTARMLCNLLPELEGAAREGRRFLDDRAPGIAQRAVEPLGLDAAIAVMEDLGWGEAEIRHSRISALPKKVRHELARRLGGKVQDMLRQWEKKGLLDLKEPNDLNDLEL